ncbi:PREDICTED: uncharacterized protein LOC105568293, partial [Vollenhovia emeryi]|uniref:uncharacterized protein LOC105568293 n=1 Tax=Vollenhovia emeryi TaxID=411798 RepID=UPI0005F3DA81
RHNTLCHRPKTEGSALVSGGIEGQTDPSASDKTSGSPAVHHSMNAPAKRHVLMATAVVNAIAPNGTIVPLRVLLDSASEAHFITHAACNRLGVKRDRTNEIVTGLSGSKNVVSQYCEIVVQSRYSDTRVIVRSLIVPNITKQLPSVEVDRNSFEIPSNVKLADPEFYKRGAIDMLIGSELFYEWMELGKIELGDNRPVMQNTKLGWIVAGTFSHPSIASLFCDRTAITTLACSVDHCETLNQNLSRFWEIENYRSNTTQSQSKEVLRSNELFEKTTTRTDSGRFVVRLPFIDDPKTLGESREIAYKRLTQLERRFGRDKVLRERYIDFMNDYLKSGHMSLVTKHERNIEQPTVYLPHHGVIKETSTSTKLRAVFDASSKTSSGRSLNDILLVGPTLQSNLFDVIVRFRFYNVAMTGDIRQMYRQVLVHERDRDYQRILWRSSPGDSVQEFRLNTVTYGQASSAYLAIKCIYKLAEHCERNFPIASRILREQTYVDDILAGADNVNDVVILQEQLATVLRTGGFETHKWCSNRPEITDKISSSSREDTPNLSIDTDGTIKTLGLEWNPKEDVFQFIVRRAETVNTKREILSAISKLFDPLGLIGPVITSAKLIMQQTWRTDCRWDDPLPDQLLEKWERFRRDLNAAEVVVIPRPIAPNKNAAKLYLQGFCDASEHAYGACIFVQERGECGTIASRLLCSKSRVAPTKPTSIPRLELCSAVLLAHLMTDVQGMINASIEGIQAWSDSQVVLWWIRGDATRWKPFVAHRVAEIVELLPADHWNHVRGVENPADVISRGATLSQLRDSKLWWSGPQWLNEESPSVSETPIVFEPSLELAEEIRAEERAKPRICALIETKNLVLQDLIDRFSSLTRIERITAYCLRYVSNLRRNPDERELSRLTAVEIRNAHLLLIRHAQADEFSNDIAGLRRGGKLKSTSKILPLHPFLDEQGVLRVGGRLQNASWTFARKHPIILPAGNRLSRLLLEKEHCRLLHASPQLLLSSVRERYWPMKGRSLARQVCHDCVVCTRNRPRRLTQMMAPLPGDRVRPSRAFAIVGVDFAGPLVTLVNKGRGRRTNKSYIALFVCLATRAIHLEATSELSTAAFLATLRRFIGRRGRPTKIYSDNATNFVGADRELKEMYQFARAQMEGDSGEALSNEGIEWSFIPPLSPHMGGIWEAGVKS